ncbi:hypothetical protein C4559_00150 [Candidatus Microgenomates bacterium]|nr:MAG: hypothetical protein C4559_00150 [Candidatus Microgenomates bacterium]
MNSFYDIYSSYEDNYQKGPSFKKTAKVVKKNQGQDYKFLGFNINLPFGIPAGPLLNSKFIKFAFDLGFDVSTYKTVRSDYLPCLPYPNVLFVKTPKELHPEKTPILNTLEKEPSDLSKISITNSFGVPGKKPEIWQEDVKKALTYEKKGQLMILGFMATVKKDQTPREFLNDFALTAKLANETGVKVLEVNLSCPNRGKKDLICYDLETTKKACETIRKTIDNTPLILKVGYYKSEKDLEKLAEIANEYASAIAAINTLQVTVKDKNGNQALPGENRKRSGVCGASIKWAGLEMVKRLNNIREKRNYKFEIVGVGGVMTPSGYLEYRKAGANLVQSATGAMWNPYLASEIEHQI